MRTSHLSIDELTQALCTATGQAWFDALSTIRLCPDLARDPNIQKLLIEFLARSEPGVRRTCAEILALVNHPTGVLHLTYNALSRHPVLQFAQKGQESRLRAREALLRVSDKLSSECIELLISDLTRPDGNVHVDVLAGLRSKSVNAEMRSLLNAPPKAAVQAAYVLALDGDDAGKGVLVSALSDVRFAELSAVGLVHVIDDVDVLLSQIKALLVGAFGVTLPAPVKRDFEDRITVRHALRTSDSGQNTVDLLADYYSKPITSAFSDYPEVGSGLATKGSLRLFLREGVMPISMSDLLWEFSVTSDARHRLAKEQTAAVHVLLELPEFLHLFRKHGGQATWPSAFHAFPSPYHSTDVCQITFEPQDYVSAATDWLVAPDRHRTGAIGGVLARYFGEDLY